MHVCTVHSIHLVDVRIAVGVLGLCPAPLLQQLADLEVGEEARLLGELPRLAPGPRAGGAGLGAAARQGEGAAVEGGAEQELLQGRALLVPEGDAAVL